MRKIYVFWDNKKIIVVVLKNILIVVQIAFSWPLIISLKKIMLNKIAFLKKSICSRFRFLINEVTSLNPSTCKFFIILLLYY